MDQQQSGGSDVDVDVIIEQLLAVRGARPGRQVRSDAMNYFECTIQ